MRERFKVAPGRLAGRCDGLEVLTILVVAAQVFPSETGGWNVLRVSVCRRETPVDAKHGVTSQSRGVRGRARTREIQVLFEVLEAAQSRYVERLTRSLLVIFFFTLSSRSGQSPARKCGQATMFSPAGKHMHLAMRRLDGEQIAAHLGVARHRVPIDIVA